MGTLFVDLRKENDELLAGLFDVVVFFQGAYSDAPCTTMFLGTQFIVAGLVTKPNSYYKMPAMRMALDFVVYGAMLAVFSIFVLFYEDGGLTWGEILFACYILVS